MKNDVENALKTIKDAMIEDGPSERGSLAHAWHCNIATACYDAIHSNSISVAVRGGGMKHKDRHEVANDAASRFMKRLFNIETKQ